MHGPMPLLTPPRALGPSGRSDRSRRSGRVGWCVLAALGLHAALGLGLFLRTQALVPGHSAAVSGSHAHTAMQVRWALLAPTRGALAARAARADIPPDTAPSVVQPSAEATAPPDTAEPHAHSHPAGPPVDAPLPDTTAGADTPTATTSADSDATFTGYARRDMLDRPPQALGIVQISYPPGVEPGRVRTGRLTLFIDEAGAVRKVMVLSSTNAADTEDTLPPPFVQAAREAFLQARFAPGERQGVAVKSRIDVEVSFDGREAEPIDTAQQPNAPAGTDRSV